MRPAVLADSKHLSIDKLLVGQRGSSGNRAACKEGHHHLRGARLPGRKKRHRHDGRCPERRVRVFAQERRQRSYHVVLVSSCHLTRPRFDALCLRETQPRCCPGRQRGLGQVCAGQLGPGLGPSLWQRRHGCKRRQLEYQWLRHFDVLVSMFGLIAG